ncbi:DUF2975 domain-containing protein [Aquimarina spongiae]|uniref:DUF2975 domain-containing protein n=1 Tax=Aquimarina spongiae TaxID=570521 RepID=A0A1M6IGC0_9FLAO|nr:DUF2975 domain-containing protein [Aquimarina spongiae]SHJ33396.1 Protein of unknown function [Aquimarina spongiae]
MRPIKILKKIINIYFYLLGIGVFVDLFQWGIALFNRKQIKLPFIEENILYTSTNIEAIIPKLLGFLLALIFLYSIALLKRSANDLSEGNHFTNQVIIDFKMIGVLFIILAFGELLCKIIFRTLFDNELGLILDSSILILPVIGLFFIYLSQVFSKAREIQFENELTI